MRDASGRVTLKRMIPSLIVRAILSPAILVIFILLIIVDMLLSMAGEDERSDKMMSSVMYFIRGKE